MQDVSDILYSEKNFLNISMHNFNKNKSRNISDHRYIQEIFF